MTPLLEDILELTDRVQAAIDAGPDLTAGLNELQQRTYRLIGLTEHHRRSVLREATTVTTGHAAAARYAERQGDV